MKPLNFIVPEEQCVGDIHNTPGALWELQETDLSGNLQVIYPQPV